MANVTLDLRVPKDQQKLVGDALTTVQKQVSKWDAVLSIWSTLPPEVQQQCLEQGPLFARFLALAQRVK